MGGFVALCKMLDYGTAPWGKLIKCILFCCTGNTTEEFKKSFQDLIEPSDPQFRWVVSSSRVVFVIAPLFMPLIILITIMMAFADCLK